MSDSRAPASLPPYSDTSTAGLLAVVRGRPLYPVVFVVVLGALTSLGPFTMDLYLPAFPMVAADLHTSAAMVQVTLTATAVGLGIGQIIGRRFSPATGSKDRPGCRRRRFTSYAALSSWWRRPSGWSYWPGSDRDVAPRQARSSLPRWCATCSAACDSSGSARASRSRNGAAPIIAPAIGSQLLLVTTWRGVFAILAVFGLAVLIASAVLLPETRPRARRIESTTTARARIRLLLGDRVYVGTVLVSSMMFAAIVSYLSTSPFIFQEEFGLSAQKFGMLFAVCAIGLLIATQLAARLMRRFQPAMLLGAALPLLLVTGLGFAVVAITGGGWMWALLAGFALVALHGFANPCMGVLILADHPNESGTAVALSGLVNSVVGGSLSLLPTFIGVGMLSLGITVAVVATIAMIFLWLVVRPRQVPPLPVT